MTLSQMLWLVQDEVKLWLREDMLQTDSVNRDCR